MIKKVEKEWMKLMCEQKEYTMEEAVEKYKDVISYMKSKKMRVLPIDFGVSEIVRDDEFHVPDSERKKYFIKYLLKGYTNDSCEKIIKAIDTVYHYYDISMEEAENIVSYADKYKVTISEAVEKYLNTLGLIEYTEFISIIFPDLKHMYDSVIMRYGSNFMLSLADCLKEESRS